MTRTPRRPAQDTLSALLHLEDEEIALLAAGESPGAALQAHAARCADCQERISAARDALGLEPFQRRADEGRLQALLARLTEVGAIPPAAPERAFIHLCLDGAAVRVLETDTQIHIGAAVHTRRADGEGSQAVTFFRRLGGVEVELHLVRAPEQGFHLVVSVAGATDDLRIVLRRGRRELAMVPIPSGVATLKNLRPGASYVVDVQRRGLLLGSIDLEVASPQEVQP